jgi:hypothetical protein
VKLGLELASKQLVMDLDSPCSPTPCDTPGEAPTSLIARRPKVRFRDVLSIELHVRMSPLLASKLVTGLSLLLILLGMQYRHRLLMPPVRGRYLLKLLWRRHRRLRTATTHWMRNYVWWPARLLLRRRDWWWYLGQRDILLRFPALVSS